MYYIMTSSLDLYANTIQKYITELKTHLELINNSRNPILLKNNDIIFQNINENMTPLTLLNNVLKYNRQKDIIYWNHFCQEQKKQSQLIKKTLPYMVPYILSQCE